MTKGKHWTPQQETQLKALIEANTLLLRHNKTDKEKQPKPKNKPAPQSKKPKRQNPHTHTKQENNN